MQQGMIQDKRAVHAMPRRRGFGEVERRVSASGKTTYPAQYATPDCSRYSRTLATKLDAEAWLAAERSLIDREVWTPPQARQSAQAKRAAAAASNTLATFPQRCPADPGLRPTTAKGYRSLLALRILPVFGDCP